MYIISFKKLLKLNGLKITACRVKVLQIFFRKRLAISQAEIEESLNPPLDRVTLYRILKKFEESAIIHRVIDINGIPKFALNKSEKNTKGHSNQNLSFSCIQCHNVFCLNGPSIPDISLPNTYEVHTINMTIVGICDHCSKVNSR